MNRDKIGTQTCYIHQCTKRYVDVHSISVSRSCLCSFLCNPYMLKIFYLLVELERMSWMGLTCVYIYVVRVFFTFHLQPT